MKADTAALEGKSYNFLMEEPYRWSSWAVQKEDGSIDFNKLVRVKISLISLIMSFFLISKIQGRD